MTFLNSLRSALRQHRAYLRTRHELANVPSEIAIEDLGFYPGDADRIARNAVYG